jgi:hypothetical protein
MPGSYPDSLDGCLIPDSLAGCLIFSRLPYDGAGTKNRPFAAWVIVVIAAGKFNSFYLRRKSDRS